MNPTPDPEQLVTLVEASAIVSRRLGTLHSYVENGLLVPRGKRPRDYPGNPHNIFRLGDVLALPFAFINPVTYTPPTGFISLAQAAKRIGIGRQATRQRIINGKLAGMGVPLSPMRKLWFASVEAVEQAASVGRLRKRSPLKPDSIAQRMLAVIAERPGVTTPELIEAMGFRADSSQQHNLRSTLTHFLEAGRLRRVFAELTIVGHWARRQKIGRWWLVEAQAALSEPEVAPRPPEFPERPLLAPRDSVCLHARRELWERMGRVWPKNLVASAREVG
jgi:hypothetical protein